MSNEQQTEAYVDLPNPIAEEAEEVAEPIAATPEVVTEPEPEAEVAEGEGEETTEDKPHKKTGIQRLKEKNAALEARLQALETVAKPPVHQQAPVASGEPTPDQYDTMGEYASALVDFRVQKALEVRQAQEAQQRTMSGWQQTVETAKTAHPDLVDLLEDAPDLGNAAINARLAKINDPELLYHLASHPADTRRIQALPPEDMAFELGQIKASLTAPKKPPVAVSRAAQPIIPVRAASVAKRSSQTDAYIDM
jgi:hypothetical protein